MTGTALSLKERVSYGLGDFGYSLPYNMVSATLLFYYVSVIKLPAAAVGTIFLVARLMDAVIDILVGIAVDRTNSRWGRTRPWFLFTAIPYAVIFVAVFMVPDWGQRGQLIYAFITFKLLGIIMSFGSIPHTAMMPMISADTGDRLKLAGARSIGTSASVVLGTAMATPLLGLFGGPQEPAAYPLVAAGFAVLSCLAIFALFTNCRERVVTERPARQPLGPQVRDMLNNRAWWVAFAFCLVYFIRFGGMMAVTINLALDVLRQPWMIPFLMLGVAGTLLLSGFVAPAILKRTGIRKGCIAALGFAAALFALLPLLEGNPPAFLALYLLACLSTSITITATFTMIALSIDHHEVLFGARNEGLLSAGVSLATKIGMALGTAGIAFMFALGGYQPGAVTDAARDAIRWSYYGGVVALLVLQIVIVTFWQLDRKEEAA